MRSFGLQIVAAALIGSTFASVGAATAASQWRLIQSSEAGFAVSLPGEAAVVKKKTESGQPLVNYLLSAGGSTYRVSFQGLRPGVTERMAEEIFGKVRTSLFADKNKKLLSERRISLGKAPGRELHLRMRVKSTDVVMKLRMYIVGKRFYQLIYGAENGKENGADEARFFKSFRILKR